MWFLLHRKAKTKLVVNGESFVETCPACGQRARFDEVEVSESFGVFFVDLVGDKERKFRCRACAEVFDRRDEPPARPAAEPARDRAAEQARLARQQAAEQARLARERAAEQARREAAAQRRREAEQAKAIQIEDELAELKKRLGR